MCGSAEGPTPEQLAHPPPTALERWLFKALMHEHAESLRAHRDLWRSVGLEGAAFINEWNKGKKALVFPVRSGRNSNKPIDP